MGKTQDIASGYLSSIASAGEMPAQDFSHFDGPILSREKSN